MRAILSLFFDSHAQDAARLSEMLEVHDLAALKQLAHTLKRSAGNTVLTVVIHPSQRSHVVTTALSHYSLTGLYQEVTGTPSLSGAAPAPSMTTAFGLPIR